jgi:hypothetical protein
LSPGVEGGFGPAYISTVIRLIGKDAARSPPLRDGVAGHWSRLKIATNVVGVIYSPEPREPPAPFEPKKTGAVRSDGP